MLRWAAAVVPTVICQKTKQLQAAAAADASQHLPAKVAVRVVKQGRKVKTKFEITV
jgi:hypothetical protein